MGRIKTVSPGPDGEVWLAAQKLFIVRNDAAWQKSLSAAGDTSIRSTLHARDGSLWVGTDGSGVYHFQAGVVRHFSAPQDLTNNFVCAFLETNNGDMWVATDEGVNRIDRTGITQLTERSGLAYFSTRCLLEDSDGGVWVGTDRGVSRWLGGAFVRNPATEALAREKVWSMLQDTQGTLWFGTRDHGLFRYQAGVMRQFTTDQGLPANSVYQVLEDAHGRF